MLKLAGVLVDRRHMERDARNPLANTTLVTAVIAGRPTCVQCIGRRCSMSTAAVETVLTVIQSAVAVHRRDFSRCRLCRRVAVVYSVDRPSG
jgi:hypothetical protein